MKDKTRDILEDIEYIDPDAASIVESLRSIGYTMETAIADLIDNSITAGARTISIDSPFDGAKTKIYILDDGKGMCEDTLVKAMRLGSSSASQKRSPKDLGRFGLGLKTATFSQCKKLSVITKHNDIISARCWDLDKIIETNSWCLLKHVDEEYVKQLQNMESGTLVVWEKLDRIISEKDSKAESNFNNKKSILRRHLSLTFHRFIERGSLTIKIGGQPVVPWNPFLPHKSSSLKKELPPVELNGGKVFVKGWVMPHRNYFTDKEYKDAGFRKGWTVMQGFYIYRGDRLLTAGGWLGLKPDGTAMLQEHHYDLGRISVDITNDEDFDWDIDIKKSKATPPDYLRNDLGQVAKRIRKMAYDTYSYRGNKKPYSPKKGKEYIPLWNTVQERNGKLFYSLNNNYPFVKDLLESLDAENVAKLKRLLKLIAETIPAESIGFEASKSNSKRMSSPYEDSESELKDIRDRLIESFMNRGMSREDAEEQVEFTLNL